MKKKKIPKKNIIFIVIILLLLISNIYLGYKYFNIIKGEYIHEEILFKETEDKFNSKKKYYATIKYKKFKALYKSDKISTIAIVDNSSNTKNKFIEMINKISFYNNAKIYLLEKSKLSKENEVSFYELDERLKKIENNYLITISNGKIISITTFDNSQTNKIIEGIGE